MELENVALASGKVDFSLIILAEGDHWDAALAEHAISSHLAGRLVVPESPNVSPKHNLHTDRHPRVRGLSNLDTPSHR